MDCKPLLIIAFIFSQYYSLAQTDCHIASKKKLSSSRSLLKDTLDGKFDFSHFLIDSKGFIPVPYIITEPSLGGFGLAIVPMFLSPKKRPEGFKGYIPPDITAGFAMYTANNSWGLGGIRIGNIPKMGIKYRIAAGVADLNMSFYREMPFVGEKQFAFGIKKLPLFLSISKKIMNKEDVYAGLQYLFVKNNLTPQFAGNLPGSIRPQEFNSNIASLGTFIEWDKRDNFFTPDKGIRINVLYAVNNNWTGSDFTYQNLSGSLNYFIPMKPKWVNGIRLETNFAFGDPPFYALPSLNMRGVPAVRFQGYTTAVIETEQRLDLSLRWSAVAFCGLGKALQRGQSFNDAETAYNFGGGFRYLIARAFKIRAGIDIAKGPDSFGWYIVFGHNWNR